MKKYIIIIILVYNNISAGCLACWNLHRVKITLIDKMEYDFYIQWNDEWLNTDDYLDRDNFKFPEIILKDVQNKYFTAYRSSDLRRIKYPKDGLLVSLSDEFKIPYKNIVSMKAIPGKYDGYSGAGFLNVVNKRIYRLLLTPPIFLYTENNQVCDDYWLSWIQRLSAPLFRKTSAGVLKFKHFLGRLFNKNSICFISFGDTFDKSVFLGRNRRISPFIFSFDPRSQLEYGWQK